MTRKMSGDITFGEISSAIEGKNMFVTPKDIIRKVIMGELDYEKLPYDKENELAKGWHLEDQARVNLALEKSHDAICASLEEICRRETCMHYKKGTGKSDDGWACSEYKVDFPSADFDRRYHVTMIGNDKVDCDLTITNLKELKEEGANLVCLGCHFPYREKPKEIDFGAGDYIEFCRCGSDLFMPIDDFMQRLRDEK
jgi:hypothetical protein